MEGALLHVVTEKMKGLFFAFIWYGAMASVACALKSTALKKFCKGESAAVGGFKAQARRAEH